MLNAKWREVFLVLESMGIKQGIFQFFRASEQRRTNLPTGQSITDQYVLNSQVGSYPNYAIIWLDLPAQVVPDGTENLLGAWHPQDIQSALATLGQLPTTDTGGGLKTSARGA